MRGFPLNRLYMSCVYAHDPRGRLRATRMGVGHFGSPRVYFTSGVLNAHRGAAHG